MSLEAPGTVRLFHENGELLQTHIELIPTPSASPDDPLNWTKLRKWTLLGCLIFYTLAVSITASCLYSVYAPVSEATGLTLDQLNVGAGYSYWAIGFAALVTQPMALAFGKRPVFFIAALSGALLNIWTVYTTSNATWIVSRLLLGFTGGPSFCLVEVAIADVFFFHERAFPLGLYVFVLYVGALLGPLFSGYIEEGMGWKAVVWFSVGASLLAALAMFFLLEETNFTRDEPSVQLVAEGQSEEANEVDKSNIDRVDIQPVQLNPDTRSKGKYRGFLTVSPFAKGILWRGIVQPFALIRLPIVLWCGVMYGIYQVYFNLFGYLSAGVLAYPPYNFSTGTVGLTFLGPLIGTIPGAIWGGWMTNSIAMREARKNQGVSEPEHKLKLFLVPTVILPVGLLMMGLGPYYGTHWIVYVIGETLNNLAGPLATLLVITYAFDSFHAIDPLDNHGVRAASQDCAPYLIATIFIGMSVTFAFSYAITPWTFLWNFKWFAITATLSSLVVNGSVLLMLKWGKAMRRNGEDYYRRVINW